MKRSVTLYTVENMKNPITGDESRVLMSDSLKETLGDENPFAEETLRERHIIIALDRLVESNPESIVGVLDSILLDQHIEVEMRVSIEDGINMFKSMGAENQVKEIQLHYGTDVVSISGDYKISALRMQNVDPHLRACVLAMKLSN